jgi:hypothetical protein
VNGKLKRGPLQHYKNRGGDTTKKVRGLKWGLLPMFKKKKAEFHNSIQIFSMWLVLAKLGGLCPLI